MTTDETVGAGSRPESSRSGGLPFPQGPCDFTVVLGGHLCQLVRNNSNRASPHDHLRAC
jgi:hypothetical protein